MRFVTWAVRLLIFLFLLAFAVKNTEPVALRFYFDLVWETPLVVLLLGFFAAGAALGLVAALATLLRQRRELLQVKRELREARSATVEPVAPGVDG